MLLKLIFFSIFQIPIGQQVKFLKVQNFICWRCPDGPVASLCKTSSKSLVPVGDIAIFRIFKLATILDFWNHEILLAHGVQSAETHHHSKFCKKWSIRCGDRDFFRIFKMAAALSWIAEIAKFYLLTGSSGSKRISMPNFVKSGQSVAKILRFFDFSRWRLPAFLHLFGEYLDHPQDYLGSLSLCKIWLCSTE